LLEVEVVVGGGVNGTSVIAALATVVSAYDGLMKRKETYMVIVVRLDATRMLVLVVLSS